MKRSPAHIARSQRTSYHVSAQDLHFGNRLIRSMLDDFNGPQFSANTYSQPCPWSRRNGPAQCSQRVIGIRQDIPGTLCPTDSSNSGILMVLLIRIFRNLTASDESSMYAKHVYFLLLFSTTEHCCSSRTHSVHTNRPIAWLCIARGGRDVVELA